MRDRFFKYVVPEPNSGCHLWIGLVNHKGYGRFGVSMAVGMKLAHRVAYEMEKGPIPKGICVLHRCDVPACVNPDHLFLGTRATNLHDMAVKGRGSRSPEGLPYGVCRSLKKFTARVHIGGRTIYLGNHATAEEAHAVAVAMKANLRSMA